MAPLFRWTSWRHLRRHPVRTSLTVGGVALGVAMVVAIGLVNDSILLGLRQAATHISGQTARDPTSKIVAIGDVKGQAEKVFANLRTAIESVGGSMGDIARITTFVVGLKPDDRVWIGEMVKKHFATPPAHTLVGISALAAPELLIEIEAIAVLD